MSLAACERGDLSVCVLVHDEMLCAGRRRSRFRVGVEALTLTEAGAARGGQGAVVVCDVLDESTGTWTLLEITATLTISQSDIYTHTNTNIFTSMNLVLLK